MKNNYIKLGRCLAKLDDLNCITINRDLKENTYDIVFHFKNEQSEIAIKCETEKSAENCLSSLNDILVRF